MIPNNTRQAEVAELHACRHVECRESQSTHSLSVYVNERDVRQGKCVCKSTGSVNDAGAAGPLDMMLALLRGRATLSKKLVCPHVPQHSSSNGSSSGNSYMQSVDGRCSERTITTCVTRTHGSAGNG